MAAGGKGFLSHKSFHPLKFRNQEAVWQAEQKVEKEKARAEELRKELKYEREMEEMEAMQVRIEWGPRGIADPRQGVGLAMQMGMLLWGLPVLCGLHRLRGFEIGAFC